MINTRFWIDDYIANLDPIEKLLFLYFLTNPSTDICGIYELPLKNIALDTGLDKEMVQRILDRFSKDNRIFYVNGWVAIKNFAKHQAINPKVQKGIQIGLSKVPKEVLDRLSIGYDSLSHLNSDLNLNSNPNSNLNSNSERAPIVAEATPKDQTLKFLEMVNTDGPEYSVFLEQLNRNTNVPLEVLRREIKKFVEYWTELNQTGKKQRWEKQDAFEVKRRLNTWFQRSNVFKGKNINKYQVGSV